MFLDDITVVQAHRPLKSPSFKTCSCVYSLSISGAAVISLDLERKGGNAQVQLRPPVLPTLTSRNTLQCRIRHPQ